MPSVAVVHLCKQFPPRLFPQFRRMIFRPPKGQPVMACDDINFELEAGELLGLVGPNGAGKTTLIRILAGSILPDGGTAKINGFDILKSGLKAKESLSVVLSDNNNFYIRLTGRENLLVFASFYGLSRSEAKERIEELASLLKIRDFLDRTFQEYSSGIKQRLALARGLLNDAPVILLDEPTKHLDPSLTRDFYIYLKQELVRNKKKTVVMTSHELEKVTEISDQVAILKDGRIMALGTLEELKDNTSNKKANLDDIYNHYLNN